MDQGPLVSEQIGAGAKLASVFNHYAPLQAAFWLKESAADWFLYLASDQIDDSNFGRAYGEVVRLLARGPHMGLDPIQVKVAGLGNPIVRSVLAIQRQYPGILGTRLRQQSLGGVSVDEVYIYPIPVPVPA